jgi:hypothetical protein
MASPGFVTADTDPTGLPSDIQPNATCDITRGGSSTVVISGILFFLTGAYENIKPSGGYTHIALFGLGMDIRDGDDVYVPQYSGGTKFNIVHIQRVSRTTPADRLIAYLNRTSTPWPTNEL